jgi:Flp pilus assembly protein TadD
VARSLLVVGRPAEALEVANKLTGARPDVADGWIYRGIALLLAGSAQEAAEALETARGIVPDDPDVLAHLGLARRMLGQADDAVELLDGGPVGQPGLQLGARVTRGDAGRPG